MKHIVLVSIILVVFSFSSALGIRCKTCIPDQNTLKTCGKAEDLEEIDCSTLNKTVPGTTTSITYDSCVTATIGATLSGLSITSYVMECALKNPGSDGSLVNCSMHEAGLCAEARSRVSNISSVRVTSCTAHCCTTDGCNVQNLGADTSTAAPSTTTPKSAVMRQTSSTMLGFLLVFLAMVSKELLVF